MNDLALIVIATAAVTAAACITLAYLRQRAYKRTLALVRAQRDKYRAEARELRNDLGEARSTWLGHVETAIGQAADDRYWPVDRTACLPAFEGDRLGYDDVRTVTRRVAR